ncbi:mannosyl-oligosaccharide alpha-1,2-mannosidase IA-like [Artemia franciscana]|uniref:alpha-1,2-Mannosidase n=1 Tax=Artemia franciscana TaxID=6661 RepID=A0AA88L9N5_ARTSF|nr:hypothetical protein QYM36_002032 [Artemia franciscana]
MPIPENSNQEATSLTIKIRSPYTAKDQDNAKDSEISIGNDKSHDNYDETNILVITSDGEDKENDIRKKRDTVKQMMAHAWKNYEKYAFGGNELNPLSMEPNNKDIFGKTQLGLTIVDALDTLYIMGFTEEFKRAQEWTLKKLNFRTVENYIPVFETNIRFVGGLLSAYALTGNCKFIQKAEEIAQLLLPAFNTPTGIPNGLINPKTGRGRNYDWTIDDSAILAEFGTLHLEFKYLSDITGNPKYR